MTRGTVQGTRFLVVTADDYGVGPATSQGILDLARAGRLTCTVLLVTSPYAEAAVRAWDQAGRPLEVGWHPCLTLDRPVAPPGRVSSLVRPDGTFWPLGAFVRRLMLGRIRPTDIETELRAQLDRYQMLVGGMPTVVNTHHHVQVFPPVGAILRNLLRGAAPRAYVRCVGEPWQSLLYVPGGRAKRALLATLGGRDARRQRTEGFPGNDWLAGVTDPLYVADPDFFTRWLRQTPGQVVELTCHPGYLDRTLLGRDTFAEDDQFHRRRREFDLLLHADFLTACRAAEFSLVAPSQVSGLSSHGVARAA